MHKFTAIQIGVLVFAICYSAMMVSEGQTTVSNPGTTGNNTPGNSTTDAPTSGNNTADNSTTDAPTSSNNGMSNSTTDAPTSGNNSTSNSTTGNNTTGNPTTNKPTSGNNPVTSPGSSTGAATTTNSAPSRPLPAGTFSSLLAAILAATLLFHLSW